MVEHIDLPIGHEDDFRGVIGGVKIAQGVKAIGNLGVMPVHRPIGAVGGVAGHHFRVAFEIEIGHDGQRAKGVELGVGMGTSALRALPQELALVVQHHAADDDFGHPITVEIGQRGPTRAHRVG